MKIDKQEKLFWNRKKCKKVNQILEDEFKAHPKGTGFCHIFWARKKQLLKQLYNINWKTPAELNPGIIFE